ncbi:unnamed protein product, partial [marine sediment metagenome]
YADVKYYNGMFFVPYNLGASLVRAYTYAGGAYAFAGQTAVLGLDSLSLAFHKDQGYMFVANSTNGVRAFSIDGTTFTLIDTYVNPSITNPNAQEVAADYPYVYVRYIDVGNVPYFAVLRFDGTTLVNEYQIRLNVSPYGGIAPINENIFIGQSVPGTTDGALKSIKAFPNFGGEFVTNIQKGSAPLTVNFSDNTTIY